MEKLAIESERDEKLEEKRSYPLSISTGWLSVPAIFSVACLVIAILFYYMSVLRLPLRQTDFFNLGPYTDAVEYFAQATSILKDGSPTIQIGYDKLPSRYPPGYPALMLPWLKCLPNNPILAPFRTNQTIGLLLLVGCFGFYTLIRRRLAAGIATLLLATQPGFTCFSRSSMSDLSGASAILAAFGLVYLGLSWKRRWPIYTAAVVLGFSLCIRAQLLFFAPLLIAMALFVSLESRWTWFFHCILVLLVFVAAAGPYLILNTMEFGGPLRTGYDFWVPALTNQKLPFSLHNISAQGIVLWSQITATWSGFSVANLFGSGSYVVPAFVVLATIGLGFIRLRPFEISAFLAAGTFFISTITFSYVDARLYLPLFFLLIVLATLPAEWGLLRSLKGRLNYVVTGLLILFLLSCIGFPSESGFPPKSDRVQSWDAVENGWQRSEAIAFKAQRVFLRAFRESSGNVLSNIDAAYLNALWPSRFVAAPLNGEHNYRYGIRWRYTNIDAVRFVRSGLAKQVPIYALIVGGSDHLADQQLPVIEGHHWQRSDKSTPTAEIMVLSFNRHPEKTVTGFSRNR